MVLKEKKCQLWLIKIILFLILLFINFYTTKDNKSYFGIAIYQSDGKSIEYNYKLGSFFIRGIEKKREVGIDLSFNLDRNGILKVTSKEISGNNKVKN